MIFVPVQLARSDSQPYTKGPSIFFIIITSVKTHAWGRRGSKVDVRFFQNLKMTILFQQNHHFIVLLFLRFWGEGGGLQKEYVLYAPENDEKMDDPLV